MWGTTSQQQSLGMNCFNVPTWIDAKPLHSLPWGILWIAFLGSCPRKWLGDVEEKFVDDGIVAKRADEARSEPGPSGRGTLIVNLPTVMLGGLVLFRSHADCERVCRLVTTNNAQYCASPSTDMPSSLVTRKAMMAAKDNVCVCVCVTWRVRFEKTSLPLKKSKLQNASASNTWTLRFNAN